MHAFSFFVSRVVSTARLHDHATSTLVDNDAEILEATGLGDASSLHLLHTLVTSYALPFVRKAAILLHVRYGVEFPHTSHSNVDEPELDRLSALLKLPSLHEMFTSFNSNTDGGYATRAVVCGWLRHWVWTREGKRPARPTISLSHPAIFELVGLPKNYDTLTDEAIRRKCPTIGKELTDPCVCLFCGEIFCSQGVCCMKDKNKGGCFQHQGKYVSPST
jgi:E3 ubiquitin-protein ligase UBR1